VWSEELYSPSLPTVDFPDTNTFPDNKRLITIAIKLTIKLKNYFSYNTQPCKCCTTFPRLRVVAAIIFLSF